MFQEIGKYLTELGLEILPYSFFAYFIVRWLEYKWRCSYTTKLVKSIWYLTLGLAYVAGGIHTDLVVMFICFIEAFDLFMNYIEDKRQNK